MSNNESLKILGAGITDQGLVREENQDAFYIDLAKGLFIVADGMGGHAAGAIASKRVVERLPELVAHEFGRYTKDGRPIADPEIGLSLRKAAIKLNTLVHLEGKEDVSKRGMGATVVLATLFEKWAYLMHLGDSRAYLWRKGYFQQLTEDHTVGRVLLNLEQITADDLESKPVLQRLSRCVGMEGQAKPEVQKLVVQKGDRMLLCSDGLTRMVPDKRLAEILGGADEPEVVCKQFVSAANAAGGKDNITAAVIFIV